MSRAATRSPSHTLGHVNVVEATDLRRTYRTTTGTLRRRTLEVEAVRGVSFEVRKGELFGLLGPNGAGKTTTIKMLITLLIPTSGTARVLGLDVVEDARWVRQRIGYVFGGDRGLYERLSALDNLRYFAELYGVDAAAPARADRRAARARRPHGPRAGAGRGVLAAGCGSGCTSPAASSTTRRSLFLDEPTIGVDPVGARELRATIASLTEAGKTVLLTTHYMFEADALCDRIAVIAKGEIVAQGTPAELKAGVADRTVVEIEVYGIDRAARSSASQSARRRQRGRRSRSASRRSSCSCSPRPASS